MIFGVAVRFLLAFLRRRGVPVPDLARLRRRQPVLGVANRAAEGLAASADNYLRRRHDPAGGTENPPVNREAGTR